ncbi:hypothetical protein A0H81_04366 [Grifola frondosa]|uniref:Uncharacterized protein n=1 Tax=Grifola frondosa TaxID=5627 RepID=A0A1C7MG36_GRIFR|nr:hypothetical protein A0H81_04366 [Grifola frondosa]
MVSSVCWVHAGVAGGGRRLAGGCIGETQVEGCVQLNEQRPETRVDARKVKRASGTGWSIRGDECGQDIKRARGGCGLVVDARITYGVYLVRKVEQGF